MLYARGWGFLKRHVGLAFVFFCVLIFFRNAIVYGQVFSESDTRLFYYPALAAWAQSLAHGALLLWTPNIFAGFPMFADGETGMLYPVNLILLRLLPFDAAFVWITVVHFLLAGLFTYAYARLLVGYRVAATVAALSFTLGGFMVGQIQHVNLSSGIAWLPAVFYLVERGLLANGRLRYLWLLLAGVAFSMQMLTVHPQVPLMTGLGLGLYIVFRVMFGHPARIGRNTTIHWLSSIALIGGIVLVIGLGLGAVQVLPVYRLGTFSLREGGVSYLFSTEYSQPLTNLITLVLPYFFRYSNGFDWGLWPNWEMAIYVGIMPLVLASLGVVLGKGNNRWFFLSLAALSLWISFAEYSPLNLHWLLHHLPGFSFLRAPGRFALLVTFSFAMLAAIGAKALYDLLDSDGERRSIRSRFGLLTFGWCLVALLVPVMLICLRVVLIRYPQQSIALIAGDYVANMRQMDIVVTAEDIYGYLLYATDIFRNTRTLSSLLLLVLAAGLIFCYWRWTRSIKTVRIFRGRWRLAHVWFLAALLLTAVDLLIFASKYHGEVAISELKPTGGAVAFLQSHNGLHRILDLYDDKIEPNRLLYSDVADFAGYSSLEERRHREYINLVDDWDERALDVANVRYVVTRRGYLPPGRRWYQFTIFNPNRPIAQTDHGRLPAIFMLPDPQAPIGEVRIVSHLHDANQLADGTVVGYIKLVSDKGQDVRLPIRVGIETADSRRGSLQIAFRQVKRSSVSNYYYGLLKPDRPIEASRLEIELIDRSPQLSIFGVAAVDAVNGRVFQLERYSKDKYKIAYQDADTVIYENLNCLPRAFLVPSAKVVPAGRVLAAMNASDFSPLTTVLLEGSSNVPTTPTNVEPIGSDEGAQIVDYTNQQVEIMVKAKTERYLFLADNFYPSWRAYVDGSSVPIHRANYLFRAIVVPSGEHKVLFRYEPAFVTLGAIISLTTLAVLIISILAIIGLNRRDTAR